ncbi:MAG: ABC transporter ATP-binding protein [Oscillospiraceae bacterium]|jgi:peptide/nickel transport system ATP-binding protein|nr:ABC transporter ATP-binding protein [Oscillospiraceae bacterium]
MEEVLKITDLQVEFKTERATIYALNGLDLTIHRGESLGLVGEAGAGKTTAALSILNLLPRPAARVAGGDVTFRGKSVFEMREKELEHMRGNQVSMIFQNPLTALNPVFTVGEQIAMVLRKHMGMNNRQAAERAAELLEMVGIMGSRIHDYPNQFSGGMRQRVGIAAGLACNPELLIADEPTTALDVTIQAQILELMKRLQTQYNSSLLMITHNLGIVSELCQQVAVIYAGRVIEYGPVREVFRRPAHPYTAGLLNAIPRLTGERERLHAIPGRVADAQERPQGCAFSPRCRHCGSRCAGERPEMRQIAGGHYAACFHREGGEA